MIKRGKSFPHLHLQWIFIKLGIPFAQRSCVCQGTWETSVSGGWGRGDPTGKGAFSQTQLHHIGFAAEAGKHRWLRSICPSICKQIWKGKREENKIRHFPHFFKILNFCFQGEEPPPLKRQL